MSGALADDELREAPAHLGGGRVRGMAQRRERQGRRPPDRPRTSRAAVGSKAATQQVPSPSSAAARMRCVIAIVASTPAADQPSTARTQPSAGTEQMASTSGVPDEPGHRSG